MKFDVEKLKRLRMALGAAYTFANSLELADLDDCIRLLEPLFSQINEAVRGARALQREYKKYLEGEVRHDAQNGISRLSRARSKP